MSGMEAEAAVQAYAQYTPRAPIEIIGDLRAYERLLLKWQKVQNLVSRETLAQIWTRHFADSLQALRLLHASDNLILDLGSGGGFPALPLAIASKGLERRFVLVEPNGRKVSFLRTVIRELGLSAVVIDRRSDEIDSRETGVPAVITSRALASLTELCAMAAPFFGPETRAVFHKGREHVDEVTESGAIWHHDVITIRSDTDPQGVLLELKNLRLRHR